MTALNSFSALQRIVIGLAISLAPLSIAAATDAGGSQVRDRSTYIYFAADKQSVMMSGSTDELKRARALRQGHQPMLYYRLGSAAYIIRDAATLRRVETIFAPQEALGAQQSALGSKQAALGREQAALGAQQARLGARQINARPNDAAEYGRQQEALGRQQDELGQRQNVLGREQDALGRKQDQVAREADGKLRALIDDAVARKLAEPVN